MLQSKASKIILGISTLLPFIYMAYFISFMFHGINASAGAPDEKSFDFLFNLHLLTMGLTFILLAIYIVHLFRSSSVPNDKKALWAVVLFMGNMFSMPIYWFLYIWRKNA